MLASATVAHDSHFSSAFLFTSASLRIRLFFFSCSNVKASGSYSDYFNAWKLVSVCVCARASWIKAMNITGSIHQGLLFQLPHNLRLLLYNGYRLTGKKQNSASHSVILERWSSVRCAYSYWPKTHPQRGSASTLKVTDPLTLIMATVRPLVLAFTWMFLDPLNRPKHCFRQISPTQKYFLMGYVDRHVPSGSGEYGNKTLSSLSQSLGSFWAVFIIW